MPALPVGALNEPVAVIIDGKRREITKREAVVTQLVDKSTCADLRDQDADRLLKDDRKKAGTAAPPEPAPFTAAEEKVMANFITRLRQAWEEELQRIGTEQCSHISAPQQAPQAGETPPARAGVPGSGGGHGWRAKADPGTPLVPRAEFGLLDDRPLPRPSGGA